MPNVMTTITAQPIRVERMGNVCTSRWTQKSVWARNAAVMRIVMIPMHVLWIRAISRRVYAAIAPTHAMMTIRVRRMFVRIKVVSIHPNHWTAWLASRIVMILV